MTREPEYLAIARALRAELLTGTYDSAGEIPGTTAIAERFDVNLKTAGRAVQQLVAERLLIPRRGQRPLVVPPDRRTTVWPMTERYARARVNDGLIFASDVAGEVRKETVRKEWVKADALVGPLLGLDVGAKVFTRGSHTYVNDVRTENTSMFFPPRVVEAAARLETDDNIRVLPLLESAGFVVTRTVNEVRARLAGPLEQELFGITDREVVLEQVHGTYGAADEPLEAVVNVRPAAANVITFETYEGPDSPMKRTP